MSPIVVAVLLLMRSKPSRRLPRCCRGRRNRIMAAARVAPLAYARGGEYPAPRRARVWQVAKFKVLRWPETPGRPCLRANWKQWRKLETMTGNHHSNWNLRERLQSSVAAQRSSACATYLNPWVVRRLAGRRFQIVPRLGARDPHAGRRAGLGRRSPVGASRETLLDHA